MQRRTQDRAARYRSTGTYRRPKPLLFLAFAQKFHPLLSGVERVIVFESPAEGVMCIRAGLRATPLVGVSLQPREQFTRFLFVQRFHFLDGLFDGAHIVSLPQRLLGRKPPVPVCPR